MVGCALSKRILSHLYEEVGGFVSTEPQPKRNRFDVRLLLLGALMVGYSAPYYRAYQHEQRSLSRLQESFVSSPCANDLGVKLYFQKPIETQMLPSTTESLCRRLDQLRARFLEITEPSGQTKPDLEPLSIVLFNDQKSFEDYASEFAYDGDALGQYVELDRLFQSPSARSYLYWQQNPILGMPIISPTLEHEYVHYLDSRYNLVSEFVGYQLNSRTIWWVEGLAEYVTFDQDHPEVKQLLAQTVKAGNTNIPSLHRIFSVEYSNMSSPDGHSLIYLWSYAVHRFLREAGHAGEWTQLATALRNPDTRASMREYQRLLDSIAERLNSDFKDWVIQTAGQVERL